MRSWQVFFVAAAIFYTGVFSHVFAQPPMPGYQDKDKKRSEILKKTQAQVEESVETIDKQLKAFLTIANEARQMPDNYVEMAQDSLKKSLRYKLQMSRPAQCQFFMLSSWVNYYAGELETALLDSRNAVKEDPENHDAKATAVTMAIMAGQYKIADWAMKQTERARKIPGKMPSVGSNQKLSSGEILDIDLASLQTQLMDQKIPHAELVCVNGSTFEVPYTDTLTFALLWGGGEEIEGKKMPAPMDPQRDQIFQEAFPGSGPEGFYRPGKKNKDIDPEDEMEAFRYIYAENIENPNVRFLGINLDPFDSRTAVIANLLEQPSLWAQAMSTNPENAGLKILNRIATNNKPVLVVINADGTIVYAGSATGFLPKLLSQRAEELAGKSGNSASGAAEPVDSGQVESAAENIESKAAKAPAAEQADKDEAPELTRWEKADPLNIKAQKLYTLATMHAKKGPIIGYKKLVNTCREIIKKYPHTEYAERARDLMRKIPPQKRKLYNVTEEDLGEK